ncbi:hypothetical protein GDO81_021438 [Engystomops pustulosus]|uniref:Uncharacterized protein n=1 Tax=Engystomops pustulosus TaxID=76066 RepID=A0AAV6ZGQ2_ENGPU|nr:hypothetical protein GDO81_021438 [Engystomops pustulosus]
MSLALPPAAPPSGFLWESVSKRKVLHAHWGLEQPDLRHERPSLAAGVTVLPRARCYSWLSCRGPTAQGLLIFLQAARCVLLIVIILLLLHLARRLQPHQPLLSVISHV